MKRADVFWWIFDDTIYYYYINVVMWYDMMHRLLQWWLVPFNKTRNIHWCLPFLIIYRYIWWFQESGDENNAASANNHSLIIICSFFMNISGLYSSVVTTSYAPGQPWPAYKYILFFIIWLPQKRRSSSSQTQSHSYITLTVFQVALASFLSSAMYLFARHTIALFSWLQYAWQSVYGGMCARNWISYSLTI